MDLSSNDFRSGAELTVLPADLGVLMAGIVARQTGSRTAGVQAQFVLRTVDPRLFAPLDGAFNGPMAATILRWRRE